MLSKNTQPRPCIAAGLQHNEKQMKQWRIFLPLKLLCPSQAPRTPCWEKKL
jgi:hypothetical protein